MTAIDGARRVRRELRFRRALRELPAGVARFQWQARRLAQRTGDEFSLASATRPPKLALLLALARGRRRTVELGTATAWTTIALALADSEREVQSFDPFANPRRQQYLDLAEPAVRARVTLVELPGRAAPHGGPDTELLYIDSSHERDETVAEVRAWERRLAPGAIIVFDDFDHPDYPGVREAVQDLGLTGEARAGLWIHQRPS